MTVQPFINKTPNYSLGTATATNGSVTVTFSGANLVQTDPTTGIVSSVCSVGDRFNVPGVGSGTIQAIDPGGEQITLAEPWGAPTQTGVAYTIYRYSTPAQGVVLAAANSAITQGQDSNPVLSECVDDGTARFKMKNASGTPTLAVGPTGTADASLLPGIQFSPTTGAASFPNGAVPPADWSKNRVINGGFDVWQAGTSFTVGNGTAMYTADQWLPINRLGVSATVAKVAAPAGFSGQWGANMQATGASVGGSFDFSQRFEGQTTADMASKPLVLSFDVNASTSAGTLSGAIFFLCNSALDNGTFNTPGNGVGIPFAIPVGSGRVSVPFPASETALLGNGCNFVIRFIQNGASGNPNVTIGAVQWEKGPVASPFSPKPISQELAACQRYYQTGTSIIFRANTAVTYSGGITVCRLGVPMRATPTLAVSGMTGIVTSAPIASAFSATDVEFHFSSGGVAGDFTQFNWVASAQL